MTFIDGRTHIEILRNHLPEIGAELDEMREALDPETSDSPYVGCNPDALRAVLESLDG